ncbi:hypothetical protein D3P07_19330 [Paenibacillus sp. 1011MAR3C5]|uniref:hypothetical protein n=1 Tax=Paenibacillus sp. 1011MAR3C5 TaxID=1675787 RepID=UPI000E6D4243|nr:hypothetical protein [Paenibacillus sp. 1011MAR3C5]RJE86227.1 hypothetical protein D3P07_19330 [Paenibacillus sp. 1011MAR3C5]
MEEYRQFVRKYPHTKGTMELLKVARKQVVGLDLLEIEWNHDHEFGQEAYDHLKQYDVWNFSLEEYMDAALAKWELFAERQREKPDEIIVLDSSIFQFQIYTFLLARASFRQLQLFISRIYSIIEGLNPALVFYYRERVEDTIHYMEESRGRAFMEQIWARDRHNPYYADKPAGAEGYRVFLRDYDQWAGRLYESFPYRKLGVDITDGAWDQYTWELSTFLQLGEETRLHSTGVYADGIYVSAHLNRQIAIKNGVLITPGGVHKKLIPKADGRYDLNDIPVIVRIERERLVIEGESLCERWTMPGTVFAKRDAQ